MKKILVFFGFFIGGIASAQTYNHYLNLSNGTYSIESSVYQEHGVNIVVINNSGSKEEFNLNPLNLVAFQRKLIEKINLLQASGNPSIALDNAFKDESQKVFFAIVAEILNENDSDGPRAGVLHINEYVPILLEKKEKDKFQFEIGEFKVVDFEIEICEGYIEIIKIVCQKGVYNDILTDRYNKLIQNKNYYKAVMSIEGPAPVRVIPMPPLAPPSVLVPITPTDFKQPLTVAGITTYFDENGLPLDPVSNSPQDFITNIDIVLPEIKKELLRLVSFKKKEILFENQYGIGFSSKRNFQNMENIRLYCNTNSSNMYIMLGDFMQYNYTTKPGRRDFSPGNQVISASGGQSVSVNKDETRKIFEAIAYSDFIGIDENAPNGLIQTEVAKRINTHTQRLQATKIAVRYIWKAGGFFQYLRPNVTISKIENKNRYLTITNLDTTVIPATTPSGVSSVKNTRVVTPLNILYYQNFSVGLDLNIFMVDNPDLKYQFYGNVGFKYGITSLRDSLLIVDANNDVVISGLTKNFTASHFIFFPELILNILPDERFGFMLTERPQYFYSAFDEPTIRSVVKGGEFGDGYKKWINMFELMVYVNTGPKGRLFARWRFNHEIGNARQNFHQAQLGYSFYIMSKNK